jgi:hypothetical protein
MPLGKERMLSARARIGNRRAHSTPGAPCGSASGPVRERQVREIRSRSWISVRTSASGGSSGQHVQGPLDGSRPPDRTADGPQHHRAGDEDRRVPGLELLGAGQAAHALPRRCRSGAPRSRARSGHRRCRGGGHRGERCLSPSLDRPAVVAQHAARNTRASGLSGKRCTSASARLRRRSGSVPARRGERARRARREPRPPLPRARPAPGPDASLTRIRAAMVQRSARARCTSQGARVARSGAQAPGGAERRHAARTSIRRSAADATAFLKRPTSRPRRRSSQARRHDVPDASAASSARSRTGSSVRRSDTQRRADRYRSLRAVRGRRLPVPGGGLVEREEVARRQQRRAGERPCGSDGSSARSRSARGGRPAPPRSGGSRRAPRGTSAAPGMRRRMSS